MQIKKRSFILAIVASIILSSLATMTSWYYFLGLQNYKLRNLARLFATMHIIKTDYVKPVSGNTIIDGAISGMVNSLDDPHSVYLNAKSYKMLMEQTEGEFGGIGIVMQHNPQTKIISIIAILPDTPGAKSGLKVGDEILAVNNETSKKLSYDAIAAHIRGPIGSKVKLTVKRKNEILHFTITRAAIKTPTVAAEMLPDKIGYIAIAMFAENTPQEFNKAYDKLQKAGMKGLILDLRNNPGGLLTSSVSIAKRLVPAGKIVSVVNRAGEKEVFYSKLAKKGCPIVVLINGNTASAAEILAGAIRDTHAGILLGTKSYGKGSVQEIIPLGNKTAIKLTIAKYYTPSGRCIDKIGIEPNEKVIITPTSRQDTQILRALAILKEKTISPKEVK